MRRILINHKITAISKDYSKHLFENRNIGRGKRFVMPKDALLKLENDLKTKKYFRHANYVKKIFDCYGIINNIKPQYFDSLYTKYFSFLSELDLSKPIKFGKKTKKFYEWVVDAMRYDAVRDKEFLPYVNKLGIKSCVYCNAQFAITVEESSGKFSGRYELDHFFPKSKYPFLCTSFFNLQPCCSHCNKMKNDKKAKFNLYTDDFNQLDVFHFSIDKKSLLDYLLNQNEDDLKIIFDSIDPVLKKDHEDIFHISGIYEQHKDIVEEIIWRYKIYNESYKKSLADSFTKYFPNTNNLNRFMIGNYDKSSDIHKRALSKLVQDIAKQLGII